MYVYVCIPPRSPCQRTPRPPPLGQARRTRPVSTTRSALEDFHLSGPSPWKILATMIKHISEQPSPWRTYSKRESCYGDRVYLPRDLYVRLSL